MRLPGNKWPEIAKVKAITHIRRMNGGSHAHMCACSDGQNYIVKIQNNPHGSRTLANELFGTLLAHYMGLPVPAPAIVDVTEDLILGPPSRTLRYASGAKLGVQGLCFGSRYLMPRMPASHRSAGGEPNGLSRGYLQTLGNIKDFAGMLVFDKWTCNIDKRQVIFIRGATGLPDRAIMIDAGWCFNACKWNFTDYSALGFFSEPSVYNCIHGMDAFAPWLEILENKLSTDVISLLARQIPAEWFDSDTVALSRLIDQLDQRRKLVRGLLLKCCSKGQYWFRNWGVQPDSRLPPGFHLDSTDSFSGSGGSMSSVM
jgi:hypothetical protein